MADVKLLKELFSGGYSSGDILGPVGTKEDETEVRLSEEKKIGGSYTEFFLQGIKPLISPSARILELGPGKGSWTRALFSAAPGGEVHTIDIQDVSPWLQDLIRTGNGRLVPHQIPIDQEIDYAFLNDNYFDFFFAFGVFCHMNLRDIEAILCRLHSKLRSDALCVVQYSDWNKFLAFLKDPEIFEMMRSEYMHIMEHYPFEVQMAGAKTIIKKINVLFGKYIMNKYPDKYDRENNCIWTLNNQKIMSKILKKTGYQVIRIDMGYFKRDSLALFRPIK